MKRVFSIILIIIYLCASCGTTLHYNYKQGKFKKLAFWFNDANKCIKHGCKECHTEYELVIVKMDSTQTKVNDKIPEITTTMLLCGMNQTINDTCLSSEKNQYRFYEKLGPPQSSKVQYILRDCRLLI